MINTVENEYHFLVVCLTFWSSNNAGLSGTFENSTIFVTMLNNIIIFAYVRFLYPNSVLEFTYIFFFQTIYMSCTVCGYAEVCNISLDGVITCHKEGNY